MSKTVPPGKRESPMNRMTTRMKLAMLGVLVVSTTASSVAWAQKAKYTRQQDVKIDVKLSVDTDKIKHDAGAVTSGSKTKDSYNED